MIKFLVGRQSDNVQQEVINEMVAHYATNKQQMHFLIIPNHIKFGTEVTALSTLSSYSGQEEVSVKNFQVLSFSRLAWFILKQSGKNLPPQLSDAAAQMLLQQIMEQKKSELQLYRNTKINSGTISQIYQSINELAQSELSDSEIAELAASATNPETKAKLHDLGLLYKEFMQEISDKFITKNETMTVMNQLLTNTDLVKNSIFYFSDFSSFSLQECTTIKILMKQAAAVTLSFKTKTGEIKQTKPLMTDYDWNVQRVLLDLLHFAKNQQLEYETVKSTLSTASEPITLLNRLWTGEHTKLSSAECEAIGRTLQLVKADSRYSEAYFVAHTIYQQVALNKARYRDFLVIAPSLSSYETYLGPILEQLEIPYFNDLQKEMKYHPLVLLIEALSELHTHRLNTASLLSIFKTGLLLPPEMSSAEGLSLTDQLENFVLKYGINYKRWQLNFSDLLDPTYANDQTTKLVQRLNDFKNHLLKQISQLLDNLAEAKDTRGALTIFYQFLEDNGIPERLEEWRDVANDAGNLQLAQQPEQVWQTLNQLLNDYLTINPTEFSEDSFFETLVAGFATATFAQIPSTLDAVTISEMGMSQTNDYQQCFIIGATSNDLPAASNSPKFLNAENIAELNEKLDPDKQLADTNQENNAIQAYQFGQNLILGRLRVYISYPQINSDNNSLKPSMYYERLRKQANLTELHQSDLPQTAEMDILNFVTTPLNSAGYLAYAKNNLESKVANDLLKLAQDAAGEERNQIERLLRAQNFKNKSHDLSPEEAVALFGDKIYTSVSQLETYYQNPFEYFLKYGLRLREREENEFDQLQTGNYFHEIFDYLVKFLHEKNLNLASINEGELVQYVQKIVGSIKDEPQFKHFLTDRVNEYLAEKLDLTALEVIKNWVIKAQSTPLKPAYSELTFGQNAHLPGLSYKFNDHEIILRGKIDRVDMVAEEGTTIAQLVDYKSSEKKFELAPFYNGLMLQMVSYLKVLTQNKDYFAPTTELVPFGAFYQTISRKPKNFESKDVMADFSVRDFEKNFILESRLSGLMLVDDSLIEKIEPELEKDSLIYTSLKIKKDGNVTWPKSKSFTKEEFKLLLDYTDKLITRAGQQILTGKFPIAPFKFDQKTGLQYSHYRDIIMFDAMLPENNYNKIQKEDKTELFKKMKEELEND